MKIEAKISHKIIKKSVKKKSHKSKICHCEPKDDRIPGHGTPRK